MLDFCGRRENFVESIPIDTRARILDVRTIGYFHDQEQIAIIHQAQDVSTDLIDRLVRLEKERGLTAVPCRT